MLGYVLRRLVSVAVTFFVVSLIIFLMMHAIPGGPFDARLLGGQPLHRDQVHAADRALPGTRAADLRVHRARPLAL